MRALLLHDATPAATAAAAIEAASHEVVRCAPTDAAGFTCAGLAGDCPLDARVDVAVVVRGTSSTEVAPGEIGVICALRDHVPLVLCGDPAACAYGDRADAVAATVEELPSAMQTAVDASMARLSEQIAWTAGVPVSVRRDGDAVHVTVPADAPERVAVLAHQAAHRLLRGVRTIDVSRV
jgi:hypothetical protein